MVRQRVVHYDVTFAQVFQGGDAEAGASLHFPAVSRRDRRGNNLSIQAVQVVKSRRGRPAALLALAAMVVGLRAWWASPRALPGTPISFPAAPRGTHALG